MLTDHEDRVLHNLRDCVAANSHAAGGGSTAALPAASGSGTTTNTAAEIHDPEDADSCDDLDDFFTADTARQAAPQMQKDTTSWDLVSCPSIATL